MKRLRIGLVGSGFAARFHLDCYRRIPGLDFEVAAIVGRDTERTRALAEQYGVKQRYASYPDLLADASIDVVDLCVPAPLHVPFVLDAARHAKHVICEKPLGGYFGPADATADWNAQAASREVMLDAVLEQARSVREAVDRSGITFCYGENWLYAPPIVKVDRLMAASDSTILRIEGEESHSGSHAPYSRRWSTSGGGSLLRLGVHPIGAALHLKRREGLRRRQAPIRAAAVTAQVAQLTRIETFRAEPEPYVATGWLDVEDWASVSIEFEDGAIAQLSATDTHLGGIHNTLTAHGSRALARANINPNDACVAYTPSGAHFRDEYLVEKLETKEGWSRPAPDEEGITGYPQELEDFVGSILTSRAPRSDLDLAMEVMLVVYAGYLSAQRGARIELAPYRQRMFA